MLFFDYNSRACPESNRSEFRKPLSFLRTVAFSFFLFIFLAGTSFPDEYSSRDAYVSAGIADARILIPFFADDTSSGSICALIYNGLTKVDKDLKITGDLAEKWDVSEDGLTITFHLRKGVFWHDGEPFTAADVLFTYNTILSTETGCPYRSSYKDIDSIDIIDAYTIKFTYKKKYAPALLKFGMGIIPEHLFKNTVNIRTSVYARNPVGTGPYRFSLWKNGEYMVLDAYKRYFERVPGIKYYVYRVIPDQSVQFLELVAGGIDSMDLNPYQFKYRSRTEEFRRTARKYKYLAHAYTYIGYNLEDPLFIDVNVRRALSYAINRKEIIEAVLFGLGEKCTGPFLKGSPYYNEEIKGYEYSPAKAERLLRDAGWRDVDNDGILEKDGKEFSFVLATNQGNQVREDTATIIQRQWRDIGVKVEIQVIAWSAFLDSFINKKSFQAVIMGWTIPADPDIYSVWHSDSSSNGGLNFISYSNPLVDELIEEGREEMSPEARGEIYRAIHKYINDDSPYTFLFFPYSMPAVNKRFRGIEPALTGIGHNFIDWYVAEDEIKYDI